MCSVICPNWGDLRWFEQCPNWWLPFGGPLQPQTHQLFLLLLLLLFLWSSYLLFHMSERMFHVALLPHLFDILAGRTNTALFVPLWLPHSNLSHDFSCDCQRLRFQLRQLRPRGRKFFWQPGMDKAHQRMTWRNKRGLGWNGGKIDRFLPTSFSAFCAQPEAGRQDMTDLFCRLARSGKDLQGEDLLWGWNWRKTLQLRLGKFEGGLGACLHHPLIVYLVRAGTIQTELLLG